MKLTPWNVAVFIMKTYISLVIIGFGLMFSLVIGTMLFAFPLAILFATPLGWFGLLALLGFIIYKFIDQIGLKGGLDN